MGYVKWRCSGEIYIIGFVNYVNIGLYFLMLFIINLLFGVFLGKKKVVFIII